MDDELRHIPQPIREDGAGATDLGPRDVLRDIENPDMLVPPKTDAGTIPNLKFSYFDTHMHLNHGGWSREITKRELPVSTTIAGVNMRLTRGGVRELHWHKQAEWAYMILGKARITSVDAEGRNMIADVAEGDLWYFPPGIPHSIQGLEDGCEFLLVFDDGAFSEFDTFTITDWFAHTPKNILSDNFGVPEKLFDDIPNKQRYMFQGSPPASLESQTVSDPYGSIEPSFTYQLLRQKPLTTSGGTVRIVDSRNFPVSKTIAAALVEVKPGGMREMHWHPNNDEWQYYLTGTAKMTVFGAGGTARTFNYRAGDVGYVPFGMGHYIQNIGQTSLWFLEIFKSDRFADISLNQWMALTPPQLVKEHLHVDDAMIRALHKEKSPVVTYKR
ncbi:oxalate decarboxylase family bicupin [Bacillus pumilus]|uniref:oxalate decarboxylase family bicupin n=1 Tax=Bacillus pumilus TaxID=1408 RepID=UPI00241700CF|nr:oxalate decarboxylase family bicupin [Bacillus pumilus]WFO46897.1 oxalate decarboxylase family bicupin [Bacillus pumilus]